MPNWCYSMIAFYGDEDIVKDFQGKLVKWVYKEDSMYGSDFGSAWLGNILAHALGVDFVDNTLNDRDLRYRGYINYVDEELTRIPDNRRLKGKYFYLETDTAWSPMIKMWRLVINKLYGDEANINIAYIASEEGCEVNCRWDPDNILTDPGPLYHLSIYNGDDAKGLDEIDTYDKTEEELICLLKDLLDIDCTKRKLRNLDKLNDEIELKLKEDGLEDSEFIIREYETMREE